MVESLCENSWQGLPKQVLLDPKSLEYKELHIVCRLVVMWNCYHCKVETHSEAGRWQRLGGATEKTLVNEGFDSRG